jgi:tetratricopeptide (TPR) repeat protein
MKKKVILILTVLLNSFPALLVNAQNTPFKGYPFGQDSYDITKQQAYRQMKLHHYREALDYFNKLISLNGRDVSVLIAKSIVLDYLDRTKEAIDNNYKIIEMFPGRMGLYDEAEIELNKALAILPHHSHATRNFGTIKLWKGEYEGALADYNRAIEYNAKAFEGYTDRALAETKLGMYNEAKDDFNKSIQINPADGFTYLSLGELKIRQADYNGAIAELIKSINIDPASSRAYNSLGYSYFKINEYQSAVDYADSAIKKGSETYMPYYQYRIEALKARKQKTMVPEFSHLEWISPVEDVNKMTKGTVLWRKPGMTIRVKVSSSHPVLLNGVNCFVNNKIIGEKRDSTSVGNALLNKVTGEYEAEYSVKIALLPGKNSVKVIYKDKAVQELSVNYMPEMTTK